MMLDNNDHYVRSRQQRLLRLLCFPRRRQKLPPLFLMLFALLFFVLYIIYLLLFHVHVITAIISSSHGDEWETILPIHPSSELVLGQIIEKEQHYNNNNNTNHHEKIIISSSSSSPPPPLNQPKGKNKKKSRWIIKPHHHHHHHNIPVGKDDIIMGSKNSHDPAIVITKYKLIFFTIQKCGGTVWKQLFRRIHGYKDWNIMNDKKTWGRKLGLQTLNKMTIKDVTRIMNDPNWIKAIMIRDPKERMLSSYLDKAIKTDYFYDHCCRHYKTKKIYGYGRTCGQEVKNKDDFIPFDTFLNVTTEYCHDKHWMPYSTKMEMKYIKLLNFVGHLETAYDDAKELLLHIGSNDNNDNTSSSSLWEKYGKYGWGKYGNESIFQSTSNVEHKTSNTSLESKLRLNKYYTPELEKLVEERYKIDYNIKQFDLQLTKIEY